MFENIGKKIKKTAEILSLIGIIVSIFIGMIIVISGIVSNTGTERLVSVLLGILFALAGCFFSWIGSFFMYGFGQLIENTDELVSISKEKKVDEVFGGNDESVINLSPKSKKDFVEISQKKAVFDEKSLLWIVGGCIIAMLLFLVLSLAI